MVFGHIKRRSKFLQLSAVAIVLAGMIYVTTGTAGATTKKPTITKNYVLKTTASAITTNLTPAALVNSMHSPSAGQHLRRIDPRDPNREFPCRDWLKSWSSPNPTTFIMTLQSGVQFQDGTPSQFPGRRRRHQA